MMKSIKDIEKEQPEFLVSRFFSVENKADHLSIGTRLIYLLRKMCCSNMSKQLYIK